jgi:hypothetical protein
VVGAMGLRGVTTQVFPTTLIKIPIYIHVNIYFTAGLTDEIKKEEAKERWGGQPEVTSTATTPKLSPMDQRQRPVLPTGVSK